MSSLVPAASALALALAAPPPGGRCTISGVEDWREYRSAHFLLVTDVSRPSAAALLVDLEHTRALVVQALFGEEVVVPGATKVVAFGSPREFRALAGDVGGVYKRGHFGDPLVVLPFDGRSAVPEAVAHELAHAVSWHHFPRQPHWFSEGLAAFLQTVATTRAGSAPATGTHLVRGVRGSGGRHAGLAPAGMLADLALTGHVPAAELLAWRGAIDEANPGRHHMASWRLYHFLWNHRSKQLSAFQARLSEGADPQAAWREAFPEWDPGTAGALDALDDELHRYGKGGRYASYRVDVPVPEVRFEERALPSAEVHLALLEARRVWPEGEEGKTLRREALEEALREDPQNPQALWLRGGEDRGALAAALRVSAEARPGDWRAWYALSRALGEGDPSEREAALRKAAALAGDSWLPQNDLAWALVEAGRAKEARPFGERALDLAPWNPGVVDTMAAVAAGIGQCKAAAQLQRRAVDALDQDERENRGMLERLAEYEAGCRAAPRAP